MSQARPVFQKLLTAETAEAVVGGGYDQVGGVVVTAADASALTTPAALLAAYGFEGSPEFVDVVRFEQPHLATVGRPTVAGERPWPTYPTGFLLGTAVPVWEMGRTRYAHGAEYWRIRSDGQQRCLSVYEGAARGWRGAREWRPPTPYVGLRGQWGDDEYAADVTPAGVALTAIGEDAPAGFTQVRPSVWSVTVPPEEVALFEVHLTARVRGVPVRVVGATAEAASVLLTSDAEADVALVGAWLVEPGVHEATVPLSELDDQEVVLHQPAPDAPSPSPTTGP